MKDILQQTQSGERQRMPKIRNIMLASNFLSEITL
jgi:hypothetical protein